MRQTAVFSKILLLANPIAARSPRATAGAVCRPNDTRRAHRALSACLILGAAAFLQLSFARPANASTVIPMNLQTIADHAGQVIVGTVTASRSYYAGHPRAIETEITISNVDYLKGRIAASTKTFTLRLPGGSVGGRQMRVCCAPAPQVGQKWLLFLLPQYKTFPTVGLYQGAFRIVSDVDGTERVYRAGETPVASIANGWVQADPPSHSTIHDRLVETDKARLIATPTNRGVAMTFADFRLALEPILAASRRHTLTHQAGQRIPARLTPVPMKAAASSRDAGKRSAEPLLTPRIRRAHDQRPRQVTRERP